MKCTFFLTGNAIYQSVNLSGEMFLPSNILIGLYGTLLVVLKMPPKRNTCEKLNSNVSFWKS